MLTLNKYQKTKNGKLVMPIIILGDTVQCVDSKGEMTFENISNFIEKQEVKKEEKIVEAKIAEDLNTDNLFDNKKENMYNEDIFPLNKNEKNRIFIKEKYK